MNGADSRAAAGLLIHNVLAAIVGAAAAAQHDVASGGWCRRRTRCEAEEATKRRLRRRHLRRRPSLRSLHWRSWTALSRVRRGRRLGPPVERARPPPPHPCMTGNRGGGAELGATGDAGDCRGFWVEGIEPMRQAEAADNAAECVTVWFAGQSGGSRPKPKPDEEAYATQGAAPSPAAAERSPSPSPPRRRRRQRAARRALRHRPSPLSAFQA